MKVKTKRKICAWVSGIAFATMYGIAGGVEHGTVGLSYGALWTVLLLFVSVAAAYKGGYLK